MRKGFFLPCNSNTIFFVGGVSEHIGGDVWKYHKITYHAKYEQIDLCGEGIEIHSGDKTSFFLQLKQVYILLIYSGTPLKCSINIHHLLFHFIVKKKMEVCKGEYDVIR